MIGFLKGIIELLDRPYVLIDVNGVGYRVLVSESVLAKLTKGDSIKLFTYTYVREDALELFGFWELEADAAAAEEAATESAEGEAPAEGGSSTENSEEKPAEAPAE